jgi:hypothetical protein
MIVVNDVYIFLGGNPMLCCHNDCYNHKSCGITILFFVFTVMVVTESKHHPSLRLEVCFIQAYITH